MHSTSFPFPLHPAPHSTQFRFCSTLNRPVITTTISILFTEDNEQPASQVENSDLQQEEAPRRGNGRDIGKNVLDEGNFSLHGKSISGSQHAEGGGSAARCSPGGISYDRLAS